jgi:hypothetical protein
MIILLEDKTKSVSFFILINCIILNSIKLMQMMFFIWEDEIWFMGSLDHSMKNKLAQHDKMQDVSSMFIYLLLAFIWAARRNIKIMW